MGGNTTNPTYKEVSLNTTGHSEVVKITYDPSIIKLSDLLRIFFKSHNVSALSTKKEQYRSAIFTENLEEKEFLQEYVDTLKQTKTINTKIEFNYPFYLAEDRHQKYYKKNKTR